VLGNINVGLDFCDSAKLKKYLRLLRQQKQLETIHIFALLTGIKKLQNNRIKYYKTWLVDRVLKVERFFFNLSYFKVIVDNFR
jgi:hypothetical protein